MAMAIMVLALADNAPIDHWRLAPTVYLSIITTLSNAMLRFAFSESSDLYWWSRLLSPSGATLHELHNIWDLAHNVVALVKFSSQRSRQYLLRLTALMVLLLAVNGPFLQRAVTVDLTTRTRTYSAATLPIRRQPMWNLTARTIGKYGSVWSTPPYHIEVAQLMSELNQRQPMALSSPVCRSNATCTTNVTIAGFTWACSESEKSLHNVESLDIARRIVIPHTKPFTCGFTGFADLGNDTHDDPGPGRSDAYCGSFESDYQVDLGAPAFDANYTDGDMPWKDIDLRPEMFNYTSYVRKDSESDMLSYRQCNLSTSFIELPIQISEESLITLLPLQDAKLSPSRSRNGVESIPAPMDDLQIAGNYFTRGLLQILIDMYAGYMFYDAQEGSHVMEGFSTRQYINYSSIIVRDEDTAAQVGYSFSFVDPFEDFIRSLDEISLRYALKTINQSPERVAELEDFVEENAGSHDLRVKAQPLMSTTFAKDQGPIDIQEEANMAVYRAHYVYTAVAVTVTYLTSILTLLLLQGVFTTHGRKFSMSPLEIAKAFSAPLLAKIGSNSEGEEIAKASSVAKVQYGEVRVGKPSLGNLDDDPAAWAPSEAAGASEECVMLSGIEEQVLLRIDTPDRVNKPVRGRVYQR